MLYSFDVFDTLITRKLATPSGIFALVQEKMLNDSSYDEVPIFLRNNFVTLRIDAEQNAGRIYKSDTVGEITLEQIYSVLKNAYSLDDKTTEKMMNLEKETELEEVCPLNKVIEKLFSLVERGDRVIMISDMYLDEGNVRKMLSKVDNRLEQIPLYISSKYGKRKSTGELFEIVQRKEGVQVNDWVHIGDNKRSDVYVPEQLGISTVNINNDVILPIETYLTDMYPKDMYLQRLIGNSLYCRKLVDTRSKENLPFKYGTFIVPMIADSYIKWVLEQALAKRTDTLYFVARDGYMLKKMADWWIKKKNYSIRTKYIYGSRYTWRVPALSEEHWTIRELCRNSHSVKYHTPADMANIFGLSKDEFIKYLPDSIEENSIILGNSVRDYIATELENNQEFKKFLLAKKRNERKLMREYLSQEVDLDENFAFVELHGGGYTQHEVAVVLNSMGGGVVDNYYYHLTRDYTDEICKFHAFVPYGYKAANLIERFFSAPEGRTVGYRYTDNGMVEPVLDDESELLSSYGLKDMRKGFEEFLRYYEGTDGYVDAEILQAFETYIQVTPDEEMAAYIGDMPVDASENIKDLYTYAPKLTIEEIQRIYRWSFMVSKSLFYKGLNFQYSLNRCEKEELLLIDEIKKEKKSQFDTTERNTYLKERGYSLSFLTRYGIKHLINGRKVVLYAAGTVGKILHDELLLEKNIEMVMWVDRDYESNKQSGVVAPDNIYDSDFDYVIIAVLNRLLSISIKNELISKGINENKILELRY